MTMMQIAKKATVQSKALIAKMDWWQKVIWIWFSQLNCKIPHALFCLAVEEHVAQCSQMWFSRGCRFRVVFEYNMVCWSWVHGLLFLFRATVMEA
jgi:hypothetical protein